MATKNYLDYTGLTTYDGLIKDYIGDNTGDSKNVTWEEYSQLPESEKKNSNIAYYITGVPDEENKKGYLGTASGELCTFNDGADLPMPKLEVGIEAVQDLHGYDAPWVGGAWKNKLNIDNLGNFSNRGIDFVVAKNSSNAVISVSANGTVTGGTYSDYYIVGADGIYDYANIPSGSYILNGAVSSNAQIYIVSENDGVVVYSNGGDTSAFNMDSSKKYRIFLRISGSVSNVKFYPMIRLATVADATFAPYSNICPIIGWDEVNTTVADDDTDPTVSNVYTIDLDGTRYGGKVDLVSGVMTVDRASVTIDENSNIISGSGGLPFRIDLLTEAKASSSASALTGVKCNFLKEVTQSSSWGVDGTFSRVTTDAKIVYFKVNSEITTIQQLKTFLQSNNLQFVYELATPLTIQLTPTVVKSLRGMNNVTTDVGGLIQLEYWRSGNVQLRMNDYVIAGGNTVAYADVAENIIQTPINTDSEYRILFSGSDSNTKKADSVGKNYGLIYNPNKQAIILGRRSYNRTVGNSSFAMGMNADASGGGSFAQGSSVVASGNLSFAQGTNVTASGEVSHAIGSGSVASGDVSFAQGSGVTASGDISHAEGTNTEASNDNAHAEGYHSLASGPVSHAEGSHTVASGNISHAEGIGTIAQRAFNHVFGKYNIADTGGASTTGTGTYIEIVGNGTDDTTGRSNARTLDWSGNETLAGNLVLGGTNSDITLSGSGNTWDGTNTSLKASVTNKLDKSGGTMTGSIIIPKDNDIGIIPIAHNYGQIGSSSKFFNKGYFNNLTGTIINSNSVNVIGDSSSINIDPTDITIDSDTWDGTNTSLKDVITALSNRITALGG